MEKYIKLKDFDKEEFVKVNDDGFAPAQKNLVTVVRLGDVTYRDGSFYLTEQAALNEDATQVIGEDAIEISVDKSLQEIINETVNSGSPDIPTEHQYNICYVMKIYMDSTVYPIFPSLVDAVYFEDGGSEATFPFVNLYGVIEGEIDVKTISLESKKVKVYLPK